MTEKVYSHYQPSQTVQQTKLKTNVIGLCTAFSKAEAVARKANFDGAQIKATKIAAPNTVTNNFGDDAQASKLAGNLILMLIDHVYEGKAGSAVNACIQDSWPVHIIAATN